jgi:hypothetical protein
VVFDAIMNLLNVCLHIADRRTCVIALETLMIFNAAVNHLDMCFQITPQRTLIIALETLMIFNAAVNRFDMSVQIANLISIIFTLEALMSWNQTPVATFLQHALPVSTVKLGQDFAMTSSTLSQLHRHCLYTYTTLYL